MFMNKNICPRPSVAPSLMLMSSVHPASFLSVHHGCCMRVRVLVRPLIQNMGSLPIRWYCNILLSRSTAKFIFGAELYLLHHLNASRVYEASSFVYHFYRSCCEFLIHDAQRNFTVHREFIWTDAACMSTGIYRQCQAAGIRRHGPD
jgi:hypothetical protein